MKLSDLVSSTGTKVREITNFICYPLENLSRIAQRRMQEKYAEIEIPFGKSKDTNKQIVSENSHQLPVINTRENNVNGVSNNVYSIALTQKPNLLLPTKPTKRIEIAPLKRNDEIRGRRGRYRVTSNHAIKNLERARLYEGIQVTNNKPILIKEYLLPEADFNLKEARKCKEQFEELSSVNLKKSGGQDFRLIIPWDAIAPRDERRCYLIIEPIENSITLREYIGQINRSMTSLQVREFLKQVLQTIWFLHNQKIRLPNGEVRYGLPHGNISLDSILIVKNPEISLIENTQFFIYLGDLAIWEDLFQSRNLPVINHSVAKDLSDLGYVSLYLLLGGDKEPISGQPIDPKNEQHLSTIDDIFLKNFIQSLLGIHHYYANADEARQALLATPYSQSSINNQIEKPSEEHQKPYIPKSNYRLLKICLITCVLGLSGFLLFKVLLDNLFEKQEIPITTKKTSHTKRIQDIKDIPIDNFTYTASMSEGSWDSLIYYTNKTRRIPRTSLVSFGKTFKEELKERGMIFKLKYQPVPDIDDQTFTKLKKQETNFLILNLVNKFDNKLKTNEFSYSTIAYDGIVIFVPFSDSQRIGSISEGLRGKITFDQLRKLYTRQITNWEQLDKNLPNLPVKLYIPNEAALINRFKSAVFNNHPQDLKRFQELVKQGEIIKQETRETLGKQILGDFENKNNGGIGFGLLSKVFGQCSVYPLSLGEPGKEIQTLIKNNGKEINPKTDLCNDKGSYHPNIEVFTENKYPLGYEITVVYPKSFPESSASNLVGQKFAEMMQTNEGQYLLSEAGLVPVRKLD
jgi:hypothetical protein